MSRLIDADALLDGIYSDNPKDVMLYIARFPTVEPRKGKWIPKDYGAHICHFFKCSLCGCSVDTFCASTGMNYCPNCGADMRGEEDENKRN